MKVASRHILEDQVVTPTIDPAIVDGHDVGMLECFRTPGLAQESLQQGRVAGQSPGENLERDFVSGLNVHGTKDRAHPTGSQRVEDAIAADPLLGHRIHARLTQRS